MSLSHLLDGNLEGEGGKITIPKKVYFYPQKNSIDSPVFGAAAVL